MSVTATTGPVSSPSPFRQLVLHSAVPVAAGIAAAALIGADGGIPSALMMCAMIYLFSAAVGRPAAAWWGFAGGLPLIGVGAVFDNEWLSIAALGAAQLVILAFGRLRGRW